MAKLQYDAYHLSLGLTPNLFAHMLPYCSFLTSSGSFFMSIRVEDYNELVKSLHNIFYMVVEWL
jgi:hypothetical protein